jgi:hypothetical protein
MARLVDMHPGQASSFELIPSCSDLVLTCYGLRMKEAKKVATHIGVKPYFQICSKDRPLNWISLRFPGFFPCSIILLADRHLNLRKLRFT